MPGNVETADLCSVPLARVVAHKSILSSCSHEIKMSLGHPFDFEIVVYLLPEAVQQFIEEVNGSSKSVHKDKVTWSVGCKFLMARKFELNRALKLYYAHQDTREREDLLSIQANDPFLKKELATEKFTILPGRDRTGAAVAVFAARLHHPPQSTHQVVLKALIYQLDTALDSIETQRHGLVFIYDMSGSKYANFDYDLSVKILNLLKGAYPARLKRVLIVTAPLWFKVPFKILRLFVKEKLRDRVHSVSIPELRNFVPVSTLPRHLGGSQTSCHKVWIQTCFQWATNQSPDLTTYFLPACVRQRSMSRSASTDIEGHLSDLESESSKDTVNEKHTTEDREKEKEDQDEDECHTKKDADIDGLKNRKRKTSHVKGEGESSECDESGQDEEHEPRKKRPPSSGSNILDDSLHMPDSSVGVDVETLLREVNRLKRKGLFSQYGSIKMEPPVGTFHHAKLRINLPKNRYTDVLCYDHSRVVLPIEDNEESSGYINANFVDGFMQKSAFISTQGPLPKTFVDFWRMIWHHQVCVIVMTTRVIERSRMKCGQYWPLEEQTDEEFEHFIIYNDGVTQFKDYKETKLLIHNTETGESRQITHLQFTSWPDYGVPPATAFLEFLYYVREVQAAATSELGSSWPGHPLGPPVVVHCSAGIGRTGTFITVDICLRRLEHCGTVDVRETVRRVRSQRAFSIQMPEQYVFCHQAVLEHAERIGLLNGLDALTLEDDDSDNQQQRIGLVGSESRDTVGLQGTS